MIQHVPNHFDHFHVRFFTPWSTLAAHIGEDEAEKRMVIDMAQQSYLPKKVNYYVNGSENSVDVLAKSFGVDEEGPVLMEPARSFRSAHSRELPGLLQEEFRERACAPCPFAATRLYRRSSAYPDGLSAHRSEPPHPPRTTLTAPNQRLKYRQRNSEREGRVENPLPSPPSKFMSPGEAIHWIRSPGAITSMSSCFAG